MTSILRKFRLKDSDTRLQLRSEDQRSASPLVSASRLGPRVINSDLVDATVDIVFIHGLTGNQEDTWTAKQATASWPELLLTRDLPQARIITYGYDADVVNFWSMAAQNRVGDHSQKFLVSLANLRDESGTHDRPLIFVAHSLGGIVCQDALLRSKASAEAHTQRILECSRGIIFMGTPHCGAGLADWAVVGSKFLKYFRRVNQESLEVLQGKSDIMARIRQDFHTMLRDRDKRQKPEIQIVCFFEEIPIPNVGMIVPQNSANLDRYPFVGIHANHMDMTKFSSNQDTDYKNVLSELRRFAQPLEPHPQVGPAITSQTPSTQGVSHNVRQREEHRVESCHPTLAGRREDENQSTEQPTQSIYHFSGTFNTDGGKMTQGGTFNSGGGAMTF